MSEEKYGELYMTLAEGLEIRRMHKIHRIYEGDEHIGYYVCQCAPDCKEIVHGNHVVPGGGSFTYELTGEKNG
jgi:hypothetical protein